MRVYNTVSTELDAVNTLLSTIGEAPVPSLEGVPPADVAVARATLAETAKEVQLEGWHCNTEDDYPLIPEKDGQILLPPDIFRVSLHDPDGRDLVQRGRRLYDRANHTYHFSETVRATVSRLLAYAELPEAFRWYITVKAARRFQDRAVGSPELHGFTKEDELQARVLAAREDALLARSNMAKGTAISFLSGWTVGRTLAR